MMVFLFLFDLIGERNYFQYSLISYKIQRLLMIFLIG